MTGEVLSTGPARISDNGEIVMLGRVQAPGPLLAYYFGGAERGVQFEFDGRVAEGRLHTRWQDGRRVWLIRLAVPAFELVSTAASTEAVPSAV